MVSVPSSVSSVLKKASIRPPLLCSLKYRRSTRILILIKQEIRLQSSLWQSQEAKQSTAEQNSVTLSLFLHIRHSLSHSQSQCFVTIQYVIIWSHIINAY